MKIFSTSTTSGIGELKKEEKSTEDGSKIGDKSGENQNKDEIQEESDSGDGEPESGANVFVKNLNFETTDERLAEVGRMGSGISLSHSTLLSDIFLFSSTIGFF